MHTPTPTHTHTYMRNYLEISDDLSFQHMMEKSLTLSKNQILDTNMKQPKLPINEYKAIHLIDK